MVVQVLVSAALNRCPWCIQANASGIASPTLRSILLLTKMPYFKLMIVPSLKVS